MVSYLSASPSLDIQAWLLARAQVQSPEERQMLRLADTRCLPQILTTLDAYQRSALLQEIGDCVTTTGMVNGRAFCLSQNSPVQGPLTSLLSHHSY